MMGPASFDPPPRDASRGSTEGAPPSSVVHDLLGEYGAMTHRTVSAYLRAASRRDPVYRIASDYPMRGGRALRATLCIAAGRVFGGATKDLVETAASLEILHNAFLVRDDVEDESEERRGLPALHVIHGVPTAINVADALTVLGLRPLMRNRDVLGAELAWRVLQEAERMVQVSVEGQAEELRWRADNAAELDDVDYLRMTLKKTCWYTTIYPCRVGALIGGRGALDPQRVVRFAFFLGVAFQIQDDLLNLEGDPARYGKEIGGDLWEGKRTIMLIQLLRRASPADKRRAIAVLGRARCDKAAADVAWLRERLDAYGAISHARRVAHAMAGAAMHEFAIAYGTAPDSRDKQFLQALPEWVIDRR